MDWMGGGREGVLEQIARNSGVKRKGKRRHRRKRGMGQGGRVHENERFEGRDGHIDDSTSW